MRKWLNIISDLNSNQLKELSELIHQFGSAVNRLADDAARQEKYKNQREHKELRKSEKIMLRKLRLQRAIMTRYQAGYTYAQIAACVDYHPKTIARFIRQYQTDLTILKELDRDLNKRKADIIAKMIKDGLSKPEIVRKLHISAHMVSAVCKIRKIELVA